MANPWLKLYSEFAFDEKMQMLDEKHQRRFIMLLCIRCRNTICHSDVTVTSAEMTECVMPSDEEISFILRVSLDEWLQTKAVFLAKNLIDESNHIVNWAKRQTAIKSSAERTRRYREKLKKEGLIAASQKGHRDVSETLDIDKELDKEGIEKVIQKEKRQKSVQQAKERESLFSLDSSETEGNPMGVKLDKNRQKVPDVNLPEWVPKQAWSDFVDHRQAMRKPMTPEAIRRNIHTLEKLKNEGHDLTAVIDRTIEMGYAGLFPLPEKPAMPERRKAAGNVPAQNFWEGIASGALQSSA